MSAFWFSYLSDVAPNHVITWNVNEMPESVRKYRDQLEGRSMLVKKLKILPVEAIVRGYIAGTWQSVRWVWTLNFLPFIQLIMSRYSQVLAGLNTKRRAPFAIFHCLLVWKNARPFHNHCLRRQPKQNWELMVRMCILNATVTLQFTDSCSYRWEHTSWQVWVLLFLASSHLSFQYVPSYIVNDIMEVKYAKKIGELALAIYTKVNTWEPKPSLHLPSTLQRDLKLTATEVG